MQSWESGSYIDCDLQAISESDLGHLIWVSFLAWCKPTPVLLLWGGFFKILFLNFNCFSSGLAGLDCTAHASTQVPALAGDGSVAVCV